MIDRSLNNSKISIRWNNTIDEILGDRENGVNSVMLRDTISGELKKESCDGVFMAIGHKPNTDLLDNVIDTDEFGYIITKNGSTATNLDGVFACGDVQDKIYRQAVTAAGSGCMSAIDVEHYLESLKK
jgi:thioredoxin reductase (NADPH)